MSPLQSGRSIRGHALAASGGLYTGANGVGFGHSVSPGIVGSGMWEGKTPTTA